MPAGLTKTFKVLALVGDVKWHYQFSYEQEHVTLPLNYIVRATCEGYEPTYYDLTILPSEEKHGEVVRNVGVLRLQRRREQVLNEAVVTASKVMMVMKGDTLVYNADAFQLAEGSMLDELIKQLPGVKLEAGGRITVNGHFVSSLLVNGKDFFNGDPKVALQNLPTYMVNKVKAYQKTPDNAFLTRSEDEKGPREDDPWVLDVALKREYAQSYVGNAEVAHSVYQAKPMLARLFGLRFSDKSRFAFYLTGNNVNVSDNSQTDSGNWQESMEKEGETKKAEAGAFYMWENETMRYHTMLKAGANEANLEQFTSETSFLPETNFAYTTSFANRRSKEAYANWSNGFIVVIPKTAYIRFSPSFTYSYERSSKDYLSAEGNRLLERDGLDSVLTGGNCGEDFINLLSTQDLSRAHRWKAEGSMDSDISLKKLHLNTLSLAASYKYDHKWGYDMQHYRLLMADGSADKRNSYADRPESNYTYSVSANYPIISISGARKVNSVTFSYNYTQQFESSERMLYRLDRLGDEWQPDAAPMGQLPSAVELYDNCVDSLNSFHRTHFSRDHQTALRWYYQTPKWRIVAFLPLNFTHERLNEWRPDGELSHRREQVYLQPQLTAKLKDFEVRFNMLHTSPSQTLMLDRRDDSNPLSVYLGNPSLKASNNYSFDAEWSGYRQTKMRQWLLGLYLNATDNAIGSLRQYNPQTGGYTYTPCNINGNRSWHVAGGISQAIDKSQRWYLSFATNVRQTRSVDFASIGTATDSRKSVVHNLNVSPTVSLSYRRAKWYAAFKASADWERLTSKQEGFETLSQVDYLYTLTLNAPLPLDVDLNTDFNLFMRRGYSEHSMNTEEWVWNVQLSRSLDKQKAWLLKLSAHDLLGQLCAVRRTLNAQGRVEVRSNTLTRNIMLHVIWKFNKKPSKK